jgi:citrate lyase subunit beta / citryl-CoA lyase
MRARSYLFVPGNRPERFVKALQSGADAVIVDLEDAVPAQLKTEARSTVAAWLSAEHPVYVRVNGHGTEWHEEDVRAVKNASGVRGVVVPKAQEPR